MTSRCAAAATPVASIRGRLVEYRGQKRLVVGVQQIGQAIAVEIHVNNVKLINTKSTGSHTV